MASREAYRWLPLLADALRRELALGGSARAVALAVLLVQVMGESGGRVGTGLANGCYGLMGTCQFRRGGGRIRWSGHAPYLDPSAEIAGRRLSWDPRDQIGAGVGLLADRYKTLRHWPSVTHSYASGMGSIGAIVAHYADGAAWPSSPSNLRRQHEVYVPGQYSSKYALAYRAVRAWMDAGEPRTTTRVSWTDPAGERHAYEVPLAPTLRAWTGTVDTPWDGRLTDGRRWVSPSAWGGTGGAVRGPGALRGWMQRTSARIVAALLGLTLVLAQPEFDDEEGSA